nr:hypothetical protein [Tanacetum cinerariifolium]
MIEESGQSGSSVTLEVLDGLSLKDTNEGSGVTLMVPDEPSDSSSSSSYDSEEEIKDISSDEIDDTEKADESKKASDEKETDEQAKEIEKPEATNVNSSLTLSSIDYTNQFLNDNPDALINEVLKEPLEAEIQSLMDVPKYLIRADKVYKFGYGTLKKVRDKLDYLLNKFELGYNDGMPRELGPKNIISGQLPC